MRLKDNKITISIIATLILSIVLTLFFSVVGVDQQSMGIERSVALYSLDIDNYSEQELIQHYNGFYNHSDRPTISIKDRVLYILFYPIIFLFEVRESLDSQYTDGFTQQKFDSIEIGMDESMIINILGEPFEKVDNSDESKRGKICVYGEDAATSTKSFVYSKSKSSKCGDYRVKRIILFKGRVVGILEYVYGT